MEKLILLAGVFFMVSTMFSMLGMGGGIMYVPILLLAGYTMETAPGISLILILATSLAALFAFSKKNMVDWKLACVIDPPTDIMAFVGGYFSALVPESVLRGVLAGILIVSGTLMIKQKKPQVQAVTAGKFGYWHRTFNGNEYTVNLPMVLTATALIGLFSGMLGITGGIIKLPIMVLLCGVPMNIAIATSTVMVAVTALSGVSGHAVSGTVDWKTGALLAVACVIAGTIGGKISLKMDKVKLKRIFGVLVLLIACRIIYKLIL